MTPPPSYSPRHDILIHNPRVYWVETTFLHIFGWMTKITFFLFLIGFFTSKPYYFEEFNFCVKFCLGLFLIYRFNTYRKYKVEFTDLDRHVAFSAGIYIVLISLIDYVDAYTEIIRKFIQPYTLPIVNWVNTLIGRSGEQISLTNDAALKPKTVHSVHETEEWRL